MSGVKAYRCLNCGAGLEFHPPSQKWKCHYCFSDFEKQQLDAAGQEAEAAPENEATELDSYHCQNCGAELVTDATLAATHCLYCLSPTIIKTRFAGEFKPQSLIPFYLTKEQAEGIYREWIAKKRFAPDEFKTADEISKITGVYAPFWLFDCQVSGRIDGEGTRSNSYVMGDYRVTNTKYYQVVRAGDYRYERVPVDASMKLDDELMKAVEPFDYSALTDFSLQYMSGFTAEKYDKPADEAEKIMAQRVESQTESQLRREAGDYSSFRIRDKAFTLKDKSHAYSMLPVYVLVDQYNGKEYLFMINGQTGKVCGEAPVSNTKRMTFAGIVFAAVWLLGVLGGALIV